MVLLGDVVIMGHGDTWGHSDILGHSDAGEHGDIGRYSDHSFPSWSLSEGQEEEGSLSRVKTKVEWEE